MQPVTPMLERLAVPGQGSLLSRLDLPDAWTLARSPLDPMSEGPDSVVLRAVAASVLGDDLVVPRIFANAKRTAGGVGSDTTGLESAARTLTALRWTTLALPGRLNVEHTEVVRALDQIAKTLNDRLNRTISQHVVHCVSCGRLCAPWFSECDRCHSRNRYSYRDYEDWDDDYDDDEDDANDPYVPQARDPRIAKSLEEAAERSQLLERPAGFCRKVWLEVAIPAIETADPDRAAAIRHALENMARMDHSNNREHVLSQIRAVRQEYAKKAAAQ